METWDAIRARRTVPDYQGRPIPQPDLNRILEAGRRSPSSRNPQRWDFVIVAGRERLKQLAQVWQGAGHVARSAVGRRTDGSHVDGTEAVGARNFVLY